MSELKYLIIHCTATEEGREITGDDIRKWHIHDKGWSRVGYSDLIHLDGSLENLNVFDTNNYITQHEVTNGAKGFNCNSLHIVYSGGLKDGKPADTRTIGQQITLEIYIKYMILRHPSIEVLGHNQISSKDCPCFDVVKWLRQIGVSGSNIYQKNEGK